MTRTHFPVKYFEDNFVFSHHGTVTAYYEVDPYAYDFRSKEDQLSLHANLEAFFWNVSQDAHVLVVPIRMDTVSIEEKMVLEVPHYFENAGERHAAFCVQPLEEQGVYQYRFFIGIQLSKTSVADWSWLKEIQYLWKDFKRYLYQQSGVDDSEILEEEIQGYRNQEKLIYSRLESYLHPKRVSVPTMEWLIRRGFSRGIVDIPLREGGKPLNPDATPENRNRRRRPKEMISLTEGRFDDSHGRQLMVEQYDEGKLKSGYMAFLCLSDFPDKNEFPGNEWLYCLQQLPFAVEVSLRTETMQHHRALGQVLNKKKELKAEDEHALESGEETAYHILHSRQEANELENHLRTEKFPLLITSIILCVSASSQEELHLRIQTVKDLYSDRMIRIEVPFGDQWRGFNEFIPGAKRYIQDYIHYMEPAAVAASMVGATRQLGDQSGFLLGMSRNLPVFFQHDRGPKDEQLSMTASAAFIGTLGAGKSLAANLLAYQALLRGAQVLIFDPKDERGHWPELLPELKEHCRIVTLRGEKKDQGKLDPLLGILSPDDCVAASETAKRILQFLARASDGTYEAIVIHKAIDEVMETSSRPSMMKVLSCLANMVDSAPPKKRDILREKVDILQYLATSAQGMLLFGEDQHEAIDLSRPLTILQVEDLKLPEESQTDYGRMAITLLMAISDFSRRFSNQSSDTFKLVLFDESWRLAKVSEGRAVLEELVRTGRSKNSAIYLISQNANDLLGEEIRSNLGCRFVFRTRDVSEAGLACRILGIEESQENIQRISDLSTGCCLMSDLEKRVNEVQIVVEPRLLKAFDTRPGSKGTYLTLKEGDAVCS